MSNAFNTVYYKKPKRNRFNLSHDRKLSLDFGRIVPIFCQEVLPSDQFQMSTESLIRLAPMVAPVMHRMSVYTHFFFVPNRIVWDNWEEFITGGEDGEASPEFPYTEFPLIQNGSLADYMGIQSKSILTPSGRVNALPFFGYNKIWNEYYRDQNLQSELPDMAEDGDNTADLTNTLLPPPFRAWRHDYFTSSLPFAQKGPSVSIPIGQTADLVFEKDNLQESRYYKTDGSLFTTNPNPSDPDVATTYFQPNPLDTEQAYLFAQEDLSRGREATKVDVTHHTYVDLTTATSNTINDLRRAFRLQEWLEKNARGGTRYVELLQVHFGVKTQDSRLQRPEYLGGGKSPISVSEVLQTSSPQGEADTPQGNLSGHGIGLAKAHQFSRYFHEHGFVIGVMSVMPEPAYQQGLHKQWSKFDKFDYFWQDFAHIGEQEVLNKELFNDPLDGENDDVFGYIPRYSEYRYIPSTVHGDFKDNLDYWHFGRKFNNRPYLNETFIQCNPGKRIFAVQDLPASDEDPSPVKEWHTIYAHVYNKILATRPVPKFGIPSF